MTHFRDLDPEAEQAVLAGCRGDARARKQAFAKLYSVLREPVFALCLHVTHLASDAEDALQEVFVSVHRGLPDFRGDASLSTWVYRIALHAALRVRTRSPRQLLAASEAVDTGGEAQAVARDQVRRLMVAIDGLPAEYQAVLCLFALEGLSHQQIAEVLGVPIGTIWSRLHQARKRLAEVLER